MAEAKQMPELMHDERAAVGIAIPAGARGDLDLARCIGPGDHVRLLGSD
jgi:hypothetical protein